MAALPVRPDDPRGHHEHGATLAELLVVMLLVTLIGGYATSALVKGLRTSAQAHERVQVLAEVERVTQRVSRELRAADPLLIAQADEVEAVVYRGGQRLRYHYQVDGTALRQTLRTYATPTATTPVSTQTTTLVDGLDGGLTTFTYTKDGGQPWVAGTDPIDQIRQVHMVVARSLTSQADPIVVQTAVELRNTGFGG